MIRVFGLFKTEYIHNRCYEANQIYTLAEVDTENVVNIWDRACKSGLRRGINIMDKAAVVNGVR